MEFATMELVRKVAQRKAQVVDALKKQVIDEAKNYCKRINNGYNDFCYQDTINKILFIELQKDLDNINLILNSIQK